MNFKSDTFMATIENRVVFTSKDKVLLKAKADWGKDIAPEMAGYFYLYLSHDAEMNAIMNDKEGRVHRLHETFIQ